MNSEPPTGDELNRMLVSMKQNVLERTTESPRRKRNRTLGLGLGLAALLAIGGGSGALALGMLPSPFQAAAPTTPTSTPTPTPTVTPTPTPRPTPTVAPVVAPVPALPMDCAALTARLDLDALTPDPAPQALELTTPLQASSAGAGVLRCMWTSNGEQYSGITINVSPDAAAGRTWLAGEIADGAVEASVGDVSVSSCTSDRRDCSASAVIGTWWVDLDFYEHGAVPGPDDRALTISALRTLASTISGALPAAPWSPPVSSWADVADCSGLVTSVPLSEVFSSPSLSGPSVETFYEVESGIDETQITALTCTWTSQSPEGDAVEYVPVYLAADGGWAVRARGNAEPISIAGADEAYYQCGYDDGEVCYVDVRSDGAWLQVGYGLPPLDGLRPRLIAAAESLLAGHARR